MDYKISPSLQLWLAQHSQSLDQECTQAPEVLRQFAQYDLLGLGVPSQLGGITNSRFNDAFWAVVAVAKQSLAAGFIFWAQRSFIDYLLQQPEAPLSTYYLPALTQGKIAGATGLSNAIKFLGGAEPLQIQAKATPDGWELTGRLPWISNLHPAHFVVAVAAQISKEQAGIFLLQHDDLGLKRSTDLNLHCMQGSHTAALELQQCVLSSDRLIHSQAPEFIAQIRPQFLTLQCALSVGVALASLDQILQHPRRYEAVAHQAQQLRHAVIELSQQLLNGVAQGTWLAEPDRLFSLRIQLAQYTQQSSLLELQLEGGASYLHGQREPTLRRVREALFLPLVSPTITQLQQQLQLANAENAHA